MTSTWEQLKEIDPLYKLLIGLAIPIALVAAFFAITAPWGFFLGGSFHFIPWWSGFGNIHVTTGKDYVVYVRLSPTFSGSTTAGETYLNGVGYLCTPSHARFRFSIAATMAKELSTDTRGQLIHLRLENSDGSERRPSFDLYGTWGEGTLAVADRGTMGLAFNADGTPYEATAPNQAPSLSPMEFTLHEGSSSDFEAACKALP